MRKALILALGLVLLAGCTFFPGGGGETQKMDIFSYMPTDNVTGAIFVSANGSGLSELSSTLGAMFGGGFLKKISDARYASVAYGNGDSAIMVQVRTNLTLSDFLDTVSGYQFSFKNETKQIGDRSVTLLYQSYDTRNESPICVWTEGEWTDVMTYQKSWSSSTYCSFYGMFSCMDYNLSQNAELSLELTNNWDSPLEVDSIRCGGYVYTYPYQSDSSYTPLTNPVTINSGDTKWVAGGDSGNTVKCKGVSQGRFSGTVYINYTDESGLSHTESGSLSAPLGVKQLTRCDKILENKYSTTGIEDMLKGSMDMKAKASPPDSAFGEAVAYMDNQSVYAYAFGDDDADYGVMIKNISSEDNNLCYNDSYLGGSATVVNRSGMSACLKESSMSSLMYYLPTGMKTITVERRVGNYSAMVFAYVKGSKAKAEGVAEDAVFNLNLPGEEAKWSDKMTLSVKVYEMDEVSYEEMPIADAKVDVYANSYYYYPMSSNSKKEPLMTEYTDDNGIAKFSGLNITNYEIEVRKDGYSMGTDYVYAPQTNASVMLRPIEPIVVTVRENSYTGSYYGGGSYYGNPVAEAKVELYNQTQTGYDYSYNYGSNYKLLRTLYTDSNGVANFGKVNIDSGEVIVSKDGYYNSTQYISSYSTSISVYLSKMNYDYYAVGNYTGEPFVVSVRIYSNVGVSGANVSIYNWTGSEYVLATMNYTNSDGVAMLGGGGIESGKIEVEKNGYENYSEYFYAYNTRDMVVYLTSASYYRTQYPGYNETPAPAENCSGNYTVRMWPSEAPDVVCHGSGDDEPSTGNSSAEWFNYGGDGCGSWKVYNVTPGSQIELHAYGDTCQGCGLYYIDYNIDDYSNSTWNDMGRVKGPEAKGDVYDFCYTPKGSQIRVRSENGFYLQVFRKG